MMAIPPCHAKNDRETSAGWPKDVPPRPLSRKREGWVHLTDLSGVTTVLVLLPRCSAGCGYDAHPLDANEAPE